MLLAQRVPHQARYQPTEAERQIWERNRQDNLQRARTSMDVREALAYVHHPAWTWHADTMPAAASSAAATYGNRPA